MEPYVVEAIRVGGKEPRCAFVAGDLGIKSRTPFTWLRVERATWCPRSFLRTSRRSSRTAWLLQRPGDPSTADRENWCAARRPGRGHSAFGILADHQLFERLAMAQGWTTVTVASTSR